MVGLHVALGKHILKFLHYDECPECGESGRHDGDCSRDGFLPGRGLCNDLPPFQGTPWVGFVQVVATIAEAPSPAVAAWAYWGHADGHWQWLPMDIRCFIALEQGYQDGLPEVTFAIPWDARQHSYIWSITDYTQRRVNSLGKVIAVKAIRRIVNVTPQSRR